MRSARRIRVRLHQQRQRAVMTSASPAPRAAPAVINAPLFSAAEHTADATVKTVNLLAEARRRP
jgi:hypothetical protein